jgi:hypothetical protein
MDQLIQIVVDQGPDRDRCKTLKTIRMTVDQVAISITPDLSHLFEKIPQSWLPYKDKLQFIHDVPSRWGMDHYYMDLANVLDQCCTHIVVLGQPLGRQPIRVARAQRSKPFAGRIEPYCAFFWDLSTYYLLPRDCEKYWRSRIYTMRVPLDQNWPQSETQAYLSDVDLIAKFQDLLYKLQDPFYTSEQEVQMLDPTTLPILLRTLDFLFGEGSKILEERRERRKSQQGQNQVEKTSKIESDAEVLSLDTIQSKEVALRQYISGTTWRNAEKKIQALLDELELYSERYHLARKQYIIAGEANVEYKVMHSLKESENGIAATTKELQDILCTIYGKKVIIPELQGE